MKELQNAKDWAKTYKGQSVMYEGIATYQNEAVFLSKDTLKKYMPGLKGRPVIIQHTLGINPGNMEEYAVGYVTKCEYNNESGDFDCDFVIWDEEAKKLLDHGYTLSTSYKAREFANGGTFINTPYDKEVTDMSFTHLAIVKNPRYEKVTVYQNATEEGRWVTIKGTHVFIPNGSSVEEVMKDKGWLSEGKPENKKDGVKVDLKHKKQVKIDDLKSQENEILKSYYEAKDGSSEKESLQYQLDALKDERMRLEDELVTVQKADPKAKKKEKETNDRWQKAITNKGRVLEIEKLIKSKNLEPREEGALLEELGDYEYELSKGLEPRQEEAILEELGSFETEINKKYKSSGKETKTQNIDERSKQGFEKLTEKLAYYAGQGISKRDEGMVKVYRDKLNDFIKSHSEVEGYIPDYIDKSKQKEWKQWLDKELKGGKGYSLSEKYKNHVQFEKDTESSGYPRKIYKSLDEAKKFYESKKDGIKGAEEENLKRKGKRGVALRDVPSIVKNPLGEGYVVATFGLAQKYNLEEVYPINRSKERGNSKDFETQALELINKMSEFENDISNVKEVHEMNIEVEQGFLKALLDRVKETFNSKEEDDKIKKGDELENKEEDAEDLGDAVDGQGKVGDKDDQGKEKQNETEKKPGEENKDDKTKGKEDELENSVDWFEKMQEVMNSKDGADDKVQKIQTREDAIAKGKKIYG